MDEKSFLNNNHNNYNDNHSPIWLLTPIQRLIKQFASGGGTVAGGGTGFQNSNYASEVAPNMSSASHNLTNNNANNNNNNNNIGEDPNSASDVKPVSIFSNDYKKHEDLRQMLDSNKENLKLDAMKRIVGMIAKGKNASDLFPAVVKNVVSKNVEIKKLVYVYLMRYAEEQQDLALLSISTFQRALKDPNQLIRASALRVLSSIRVPIITTIMLLAIKEAVSDMSPYVRKTAANAITKLYNLDPDLKDELIEIIEKLLADKTILVAGSAIQAFEEVCPERIDLIHKNYRKLCNLLIDVDEWGQVVIINMLTRYARNQFVSPGPMSEVESTESSAKQTTPKSKEEKEKKGEDDEDDEDEDEEKDDFDSKFKLDDAAKTAHIDPDHRLLLRVTKPLLQSRNSAVVMAVAQLYYYVAPRSEAQIVAKSLVRLLRSHREVQIVVLKNIVSMAQKNHAMFQPHQKSFYVHSNDSIHVKLLKLEILTCLANPANISIILREFQAYVLSNDKEFAAATINAIGRCASSIKEVSENCLSGLVNLMSKKDETIVAESVVVIKRLLQSNPSKNSPIIKKMAKMADKITVPSARASIVWLIGEYSDRVPKIAPDVLRKMAKTFCDEENIVKLQIINLAVKLLVTNPKQVTALTQYVLNLAKYDQNYDIRDRARFLRALLINPDKCPSMSKHAKKILLASKPAPLLQSAYKDTDQYQLGTLSHALSMRVNGYVDLPGFPAQAPDPTVRNVEPPPDRAAASTTAAARTNTAGVWSPGGHKKRTKASTEENFYSDEDDKSQSTEGADPTNDEDEDEDEDEDDTEKDQEDDEDESESGSEDESEEEESSDEDDDDDDDSIKNKKKKKKNGLKSKSKKSESESESSSEEEEDEDEEDEESSSSESEEVKKPPAKKGPEQPPVAKKPQLPAPTKKAVKSESESSEESSSESSESSEEPEVKPSAKTATVVKKPETTTTTTTTKAAKGKNKPEPPKKEVSLLDLDFSEGGGLSIQPASASNSATSLPVLSPSLADLANLGSASTLHHASMSQSPAHASKKEYELLSKINGNGIQISYRFSRGPNKFSPKAVTIELKFTNFSNGDFNGFAIGNKKLQSGMSMSDLAEFDLPKGSPASTQTIAIDFNDTLQAAQFELTAIYSNDPTLGGTSSSRKWPNLSITCPIGELVQPGWGISENEFNRLQASLKGMNEVSGVVDELSHASFISKNMAARLLENVNMCQIPSSQQDTIKYAALTSSSKTPLLMSLFFAPGASTAAARCQVNVNCEKIVLANMFIKEIKQLLVAV